MGLFAGILCLLTLKPYCDWCDRSTSYQKYMMAVEKTFQNTLSQIQFDYDNKIITTDEYDKQRIEAVGIRNDYFVSEAEWKYRKTHPVNKI